MTGDIIGNNRVGGVIGDFEQSSDSSYPQSGIEFINSMSGNITATVFNSYSGGIIGFALQNTSSGGTLGTFMNYMGGNITNTGTSPNYNGGMIGRAIDIDTDMFTNSINAMNGDVYDPGTYLTSPAGIILTTIDISFGLTFTRNSYSSPDPLTGFATDPGTGLPIVDLTATDPDGVVHTFAFVFGNTPRFFNQLTIETTGDNLSFAEVQLLAMDGTNIAVLGTASGGATAGLGIDGATDHLSNLVDISVAGGPTTWTLDLDRGYKLTELNRVLFYNRGGGSTEQDYAIGSLVSLLSSDGSAPEQVGVLTNDLVQEFIVTPSPELLLLTPRVARISATVAEVPGASTYRITVRELPSGTTRVAHTEISTGDVAIKNLKPSTSYMLTLYANFGDGYEAVDWETIQTRLNSAENYDKSQYAIDGRFDLSTVDTSEFALLGEVMNDVFATGDNLEISLGARKSKVSFVRRGETVSTESSILVPFDTSVGSGQAFTMQLSDASTLAVTFDETQNSISIGGQVAPVGGSVLVDGKKCTLKDL